MPLPSGGQWPPQDLAPVFGKLNEWSAWYAGDPDLLARVYGGQANQDQTRTGFFASQQGGFVANAKAYFQRWFHGTATAPTEQRTKLHIPVAGDIAATSSELLFAEPPSLIVEAGTTQDRLTELIDDGMHATFLEAAEVCSALGAAYLRVCWDKEVVPDRPWLAAVHADAAVPDFKYGRLTGVTFWQVLADDGKQVIRHLERHEPGVILHGVYVGDRNELGRRIALTDMPETAGLADSLTGPDEIATEVPYLTACYVPNMRPNRLWRNVGGAAAYCGRSDYQGVEQEMDALDEVYSSWMRDLRLAKARLIVPEIYLQSEGRGKGARFDAEQEIYSTVNALGGTTGQMQLTPVQFQIRVQEHMESAQHLLEQILRGAGYSSQTFGLSGDVAVTATEVAARERKSYITRDKKINYWRPALRDILQALLAVDAAVFNSGATPEKPTIEFGNAVSEDPGSLAQTAQQLRAAEAASTETLVKLVNPDWDEDQVAEEVALIKAETPAMVMPPAPMDSGPGADLGMGGPPGPGQDQGLDGGY